MDDIKKKKIIKRNFLESLKDIGSGFGQSVKKDVLGGVTKNSFDQMFGRSPQSSFSGSESSSEKFASDFERKEKFKWSGQDFTNIRTQERVIFKKAEEEVKLQIQAIRSELIKLVQGTQELAKEVKIAAMQAPLEPGVYHLTFLEKLREFIIFMRKNISESRHWLALCNQKSKKRNYYWGQVRKSGTQFMLSQERYMSTQTG
ncbi:MAG TPA: DUF5660 family protein [Candidatus Bathyarchaeia archaeon]|nr:DUF5660 family protein [Candidatus Bathyarchaeia archaeon]